MTRKLLSPNGPALLFEIGNAANLNDCTAPGLYHQASNAEAAAGTNYPTPYAGFLEVMVDASGGYIYQRYHTYRVQNTMWYRSFYNSAWSTWQQVLSTTNVNYLYVDSGYTLTGASGSAIGNPGATDAGAINIEGHLKLFVNTDAATESGYGDYDADIWMKDNGYIFAEQAIHLRPTNTGSMGSYNEQGRVVFKSEELTGGGINYIQSGNNYSGTVINDLAIGPYSQDGSLDEQYWAYFQQGTGNLGLGITGNGTSVPSIPYKLHVKDFMGSAPTVMIESGVANGAKLYLKDSNTTTATNNGLVSDGNNLTIRAGGSDVVSASSSGLTVTGTVTATNIKTPLYYMVTGTNTPLFSGITGLSVASVFGSTGTNLAAGSYLVECVFYIESTTVAATATHSLAFGSSSGTAVPSETLMFLSYNSSTTVVGNAAALSGVRRPGTTTFPSLTLTAIAANTTNVSKGTINAIVRIGTAGNFTLRYTATPTGGSLDSAVLPGSYLKITPISTQTATTVGTWA